MNFCESC